MENLSKNQGEWYVLQVMSGQENRVFNAIQNSRDIDAHDGIDDCIDDIKIPVDKVEVTTTGRRGEKKVITRDRKRYPGYVLIQARLYDAERKLNATVWDLIKNTQGVIGFVGGEKPVALSPADVSEMLRSEEEAQLAPKTKVLFNVGENVTVKSGAFQGFSAVIEGIDNERARLKVSVNIFGRATALELGVDEVEKVVEE